MASWAILVSVYRGAAAPSLPGRTEVALAQGQRVAHGPVLDQADQGIVDRGVAVGVVLAHDLAHHTGALVERTVRPVAAVEHRVQHAAVDGLEAVAHVGKGTAHNDGHGVVQVGPLHFGLQVHLLHAVDQHIAFKYGFRKIGGFRRVLGCLVTHRLYFPFQVYVGYGISVGETG